jgi:hypothetical protein
MADEPGLRDTKVVVISAREEVEGTIPLGSEMRISKPQGFHLAELIQVVGAVLNQIGPTRTPSPATAPGPRGARPE